MFTYKPTLMLYILNKKTSEKQNVCNKLPDQRVQKKIVFLFFNFILNFIE